MDKLVDTATNLAREWHRGLVDKGGVDYFEGQLLVVASLGHDWKERVVGYLHDAAEDTAHTVAEIMLILRTGFTEDTERTTESDWAEIEDAINMMNQNTASDREKYIERFRGHRLAIRVKLNDLYSNIDLSRIPNPTKKDRARRQRYFAELRQLRQLLEEIEVRSGEFANEFMHYEFLADEMSELEFMVMLAYARHRKGLSMDAAIASVNRQRPSHFPELSKGYYITNA